MNKFKFKINEKGFYCGYGSDGTIPMTEEFNLSNLPTDNHKHNGNTWVLDDVKVKEEQKQEIYAKLDKVTEKLVYNKARYGNQSQYAESYEARKQELIAEQADLIKQLEEV